MPDLSTSLRFSASVPVAKPPKLPRFAACISWESNGRTTAIDNQLRLTYGCAVSQLTRLTDLSPSEAADAVSSEADPSWTRQFVDALDRRVRAKPLERILSLWGLSNAAAARMFGVSRQAFSKWLHNGPPANRATSVADLAAVTDLLARYVKRERIPAIVRRQAPAFEGVSLLHLAEQGRTGEALDRVRATFDLRRVQP